MHIICFPSTGSRERTGVNNTAKSLAEPSKKAVVLRKNDNAVTHLNDGSTSSNTSTPDLVGPAQKAVGIEGNITEAQPHDVHEQPHHNTTSSTMTSPSLVEPSSESADSVATAVNTCSGKNLSFYLFVYILHATVSFIEAITLIPLVNSLASL